MIVILCYRKKNSSNFTGKEMISVWTMLDDNDMITKKLIRNHAWWFEPNTILLALKNSLMITMQTKMTKLNEKSIEDLLKQVRKFAENLEKETN